MSYAYTHAFPALRGVQAGRTYYVMMCPLYLVPKLFTFNEAPVPPALRAQRTLNMARVPEITRYIVQNPHDYAFSAITASIDGEVRFESVDLGQDTLDVGKLIVPMSAHFIINDGQHRRAAIEAALEEQPSLADETIAVVLYVDAGLRRSQQLFADLNKHAVRPTQSLGILYDYRDPLACLARELADNVFCFKNLTEFEGTSISNRGIKLFTLSGIYQATGALLGKRKNESISSEEQRLAQEFWTRLGETIPEWKLAAERKVTSSELRRDYVHAHGIILHALGLAGHTLLQQHPADWTTCISHLNGVDWSRSNTSLWEGKAMNNGKMSKQWQNVQASAAAIRSILNVPVTQEVSETEHPTVVSHGTRRLQAASMKQRAHPRKRA